MDSVSLGASYNTHRVNLGSASSPFYGYMTGSNPQTTVTGQTPPTATVGGGGQMVPQQQQQQQQQQQAAVGSPAFMTSSLSPYNASQQSTAGGNSQLQALLQQLMQQAQGGFNTQLSQYKNLMSSIMGPTGFLSQLGKTGEQRIATNEANQKGAAEQDAVSRGLGNTTIRSNLLAGVSRDSEQARQSLGESVAGQKASTSMQLFGMNPQPGMDTYLRLLTQLGSAAGPTGSSSGGVSSIVR